ncbi:MAG: bifunctional proline dehydrogenase/L-glutamate gamma-semialdehyde dehydrogenase [Candidatus Lambdaproteobacteria bacterium]|nr:bifunctional proline dehydrogenase/L-glutamate gamma-semialdehyde dehydrogenase [Candidatus Lambdaproteobacteria bacterium]
MRFPFFRRSPFASEVRPPEPTATGLEARIQQSGRALFERMRIDGGRSWGRRYWSDKLLELCLDDERFKAQAFRFIDVLPSLHTPEQLALHIQEYFGDDAGGGARLLQWALGVAGGTPLLAGSAGHLIRRNVLALARQFIVAEAPEVALPLLEAAWREGFGATVDLLGEKAVSEREALAYQERYLQLVERLAEAMAAWPHHPFGGDSQTPRANISVKLSSLYSRSAPADTEGTVAALKERLRPILRRARDRRAFVCLDMELYRSKDIALRVFRELMEEPEFAGFADAGVALQAYLKETLGDLREFIAWSRRLGRRFTVRLVKGAYWDYETIIARQENWPCPVFEEKWRTDASFEQCCRLLMTHHDVVRAAIGSHNVRSLATAMALEQELRLPRGSYEFQVLYGMGTPIARALHGMGYFVRHYAPVGDLVTGMAYLVRRLLENTSNESFLRQRFAEGKSPALLLRVPAPPAQSVAAPPPEPAFRNAPKLEFQRAEVGARMREAIRRMALRLPMEVGPILGGRPLPAAAGGAKRRFRRVNPSHPDRVVGEVRAAGPAEVEEALARAEAAFPAWQARPCQERADLLRRAAERMLSRRFDLCALMVHETGKTWYEADLDVVEAVDFLRYYARQMERLGEPRRTQPLPGEDNRVLYQPRGVGAVIAPWNFPLAISTGMASAALVTGNCVLYKPAEQSSVTAAMLVEVLLEAGIPGDVLAFLPGYGEEIGAALVADPRIRFIAFTGSKDVGLKIVEAAARTHTGQRAIKRVIAEMGGKNAIIVDDDADLDEAVRGILQSAFGYQGQKCSAASRVIALPLVSDRLLTRLGEAVRDLRLGPAEAPGPDVGPLIDEDALAKVRRYLAQGERTARVVARAGPVPAEGFFVPPTVFTDVEPDSPLVQEEIFGPVLVVQRAPGFDAALALANGTPYALTGGVYSRSPRHLEQARREFRVGNLYINRGITGAVVQRQPFGGFGMSGMGSKAGGPDYLLQFLEPRTITENLLRQGFAPPTG